LSAGRIAPSAAGETYRPLAQTACKTLGANKNPV
jgi:hypothetical protein